MGEKGTERKISFLTDSDSAHSSAEEEGIETEIEITVDSIENVLRNENVLVKFAIKHEEATLGESRLIKLNAKYDNSTKIHPIGFKVALPYCASDTRTVRPLVSSPVLIQLYEVAAEEDNASARSSSTLKRKDSGNNRSKPKRASTQASEAKLVGMCSVDLLPIVLGEKTYSEKLVAETASYAWDGTAVSWANLPRICVTLTRDDARVISENVEFNVMSVTIESIFNLPACFDDCLDYECATVVNTDAPVNESLIVFESGRLTEFRDAEKLKAWRPLQKLESRARFSKYAIGCDYDGVRNEFKGGFDLKDAVKGDLPRIEWNSVQRILLEEKDVRNICDRLKRRKFWPFEIRLSERAIDGSIVYQCYADASQLLFPGKTSCRVLAQLHTRSSSEMEEKTDLGASLFSADGSDSVGSSQLSRENCEEDAPSYPLFAADGRPTLILVELELCRPFVAARVLEDYAEAIEALKARPKPRGSIYAYTPDLAHEQYLGCVKHLADVLAESYRDFVQRCECQQQQQQQNDSAGDEKCQDELEEACRATESSSSIAEDVGCPYLCVPDELSRFEQYLHETGEYASMRSTLKGRIINLLDQKFVLNSAEWCSAENQNLVASCYTYLTEQMHVALNAKLDVRLDDCSSSSSSSTQDLWFRSEEAFELGDYAKADELLARIVSSERDDPDSWLLYAIHSIKSCNVAGAIECCRKAIELSSRHKIALTFYGVLLATSEDYANAEVFLKAVVSLHPRFAEGWAVLHLLYVKIQYYPGIELTLELADKCLRDRVRDTETTKILSREPLAWSTLLCKGVQHVFASTAVLMLKLNLYGFAGLALAQEQCQRERSEEKSVELLYLISVNRYLQGDYAAALRTLGEAEQLVGLDYSVAALTGHAHHKLGDVGKAVAQYEAVDMMYDRPEDVHAVHLRMGYHYVDIEEYARARSVFLRDCKVAHSCRSWLGVGICGYHLEKLDEAEAALMEANRIDSEDPEVWAYLCLLSMALHRQDEFAQCYRQTVKNNLRSDKIWQIIRDAMDAQGYCTPIAVLASVNERCTC